MKNIKNSLSKGINVNKKVNKKSYQNQHGITIVSLAVTVVVLMMIAIPCIVNIKTVTEIDKFTKLRSDITALKESISQVYGSEADISKIGPKYTGDTAFLTAKQGEVGSETDTVKNPNDNNVYYIINVTKLKRDLRSKLGITLAKLNYGSNNYGISTLTTELNKEKVYIINEKSRTIYYTEAIEYESQSSGKKYIYYRLPEDYSTMTTSRINRANAPVLKKGMTPVKFEINKKDTSKMKTVATTADDENWYNYEEKRWANAKTEDGSLWVWIPRFAYRIIQPSSSDTARKGTTEIVFLTGVTDSYIDENGKTHTDTKRCKTEDDVIDTTTGYTVHPAFTDESKINFRNGGWDRELYGIWVAKFEAAYATSSNVSSSKVNVSSGINYTQTQVCAPQTVVQTENPSATSSGWVKARNYVDGIYGSTPTTIKYPTFQGSSYSMNYINHNDAFLLAKNMTGAINIYGLSSNDTDSHMMKNSEWGAVAYLSKSQYGLSSTDIAVNKKNFNDDTNNVYAGTGYNNQGKAWNDTTINFGNSASTTGNIYGIYDMSGGTWERSAAYVNNSQGVNDRNLYGQCIVKDNKSTKYVTMYKSDEENLKSEENAKEKNYNANAKIYGDAIRETSTNATGNTSWYIDYSNFPSKYMSFFDRSGAFWSGNSAGLFLFCEEGGYGYFNVGFRPVLV